MLSSLIVVTIMLGSLIDIASEAKAATIYVQGGTWSYGVGSKYVWSYFQHNNRYHGSTAIGKYKTFSGVVRPGYQSKASAEKAWTSNRSYYSFH